MTGGTGTINAVDVGYDAANLSITKSAIPASGSTVFPGDTIDYSILVSADALGPQNDVRVNDTLPSGVTFVPNSVFIGGINFDQRAIE